MVMVGLSILGSGLLWRSFSESNVVQRHANSCAAFWLAEAGIARAINSFPQSPINDILGDANHTYSTQTAQVVGFIDRFAITSIGTVTLPSGSTITRTVEAVVRQPQFGAVDNAITATGDVIVGGAAQVNGNIDDNSTFNFEDIFDLTQAQVKAQADHFYLDPPNDVEPVDGITWIEMTPGEELVISSNLWNGSGILIVEGDLKIAGGDFSGILWVTGTLQFTAGNPDMFGAIFVDCGASDTVVLGTAEITHDPVAIAESLGSISPVSISWSEL